MGIKAVPVECDQHSFLSPYTNYVSFNDTLPKDRAALANLLTQYDALKIVSKEWMMSQIGVENIPDMIKQIEQEQRTSLASQGSSPVSKTPGAGQHLIREPGVVKPTNSVIRNVPQNLRAKRPNAPGRGAGSNVSTSV
jgi:hypothetical protein